MSLKIEHLTQTVNSSDQLLCCFDVSKASLSLYTEYQYADQPDADQPEPEGRRRASRIEEEIPNQTGAIEQLLARLEGLAEVVIFRIANEREKAADQAGDCQKGSFSFQRAVSSAENGRPSEVSRPGR